MFKSFKSALFVGASLSVLAAPALAQQTAQADTEAVIVTGTRVTGMTAADSAAPVTVIGSDALSKVGQPNLTQALSQLTPSFTAESLGGDTAALTLSARLRGLSPNDTLVLVDGKRRHPTGNLHVLGGQYQGAATADLDMIPLSAIDHVEVLQEGAAAQYGTDAIAGVVNIILKKKDSGGILTGTAGQYEDQGGQTYDFSGNFGFALGSKGFINFTAEKRFRGFSQRGGQDIREVDATGTPRTLAYPPQNDPDYPNVNHITGDPESMLTTGMINAGYEVAPGITVYGNVSYGERQAKAYENYRVPNRVETTPGSADACSATNPQGYNTAQTATGAAACAIGIGGGVTAIAGSAVATPGRNASGTIISSGSSGTYTTPGELIFNTKGFNPQEGLKESDYGYTLGVKGESEGWHWDLSGTYGKDRDEIYTYNSANASLWVDTHTTPTNFYDGTFTATEATLNLDVTKDFDLGWATPLTVAVGAEGRENTFGITPGDPGSRYKEGGQSYPGFQLSDAGAHSRKSYAAYVDFAASPIKNLSVDLAGRYEHYTDFGDTTIGKVTARYDITPEFAVRGTISTGFRAPSIQEEFYSATNVSPTSAIVQLPPNSAAASILGVKPLQPEASTNYSLGFVAHPLDNLSLTVDAYSISLRNRIVGTGTLYGSGGAINSPIVTTAIIAHGNVLDPTVSQTGVSLFVNGISTLTQGIDVSANYVTDFGSAGNVTWTLAGNYNDTSISKMISTPSTLAAGVALFSQTTTTLLTHANPKEKIGLSALWELGDWSVNLRETLYGPSSVDYSPNGGTYYTNKVPTTGITDAEVDYHYGENWTIAFGANNLFNEYPPARVVVNATTLSDASNVVGAPLGISPFGINGGFYYTRLTFNF